MVGDERPTGVDGSGGGSGGGGGVSFDGIVLSMPYGPATWAAPESPDYNNGYAPFDVSSAGIIHRDPDGWYDPTTRLITMPRPGLVRVSVVNFSVSVPPGCVIYLYAYEPDSGEDSVAGFAPVENPTAAQSNLYVESSSLKQMQAGLEFGLIFYVDGGGGQPPNVYGGFFVVEYLA